MYFGESIDGVEVFNNINHNEHHNPHPQYEQFQKYRPDFKMGKYNTIFDITLQNQMVSTEKNRGCRNFIFSTFVYTGGFGNIKQQVGILTITAIIGDTELNATMKYIPICGETGVFRFRLLHQKNTSVTSYKEFNLKLLMLTNYGASSPTFQPIMYDSRYYNHNRWKPYADSNFNIRDRVINLFETGGKLYTEIEYETLIKDYKVVEETASTPKKVNYSEGTEITINRHTRSIMVTATNQVELHYIHGGEEGQRVVIYSNGKLKIINKATDVKKTNNIMTKERANKSVQNDHIVVLNYINGRWYETE